MPWNWSMGGVGPVWMALNITAVITAGAVPSLRKDLLVPFWMM